MTTEKTIEKVKDIIATLDNNDRGTAIIAFEQRYSGRDLGTVPIKLGILLHELCEDLYLENAKKLGKADVFRTLKKIVNNTNKENLRGLISETNETYTITNGYMLFNFKNKIDGLEENQSVGHIDTLGILERAEQSKTEQVEIPDIAALKTYVKANKKTKLLRYDFGEQLPYVDARYMLDVLTVCPNIKLYNARIYEGLYFENDDKTIKGVLCGVRPEDIIRKKTDLKKIYKGA